MNPQHALRLRRALKELSHHSTADWDFELTDWELSSAQYVSAPTSLHGTNGTVFYALIRTAVVPVTSVKQGRISMQVRWTNNEYLCRIFFRYQDANNYYRVDFKKGTNLTKIVVVVGGEATTLRQGSWTSAINTWYPIRVTWWNDYVGLAIRFERLIGEVWTAIIPETYDSNNRWQDEGGRVGFGFCGAQYIDDTVIYGVV